MSTSPTALVHEDPAAKTDEALRDEARAHLAKSPALQIVAELLTRLRELSLPWWTPAQLRDCWTAGDRMHWLRQRPDLRQAVTTRLTGLAPKAARNKEPSFQAGLIDSVLDDGDIDVRSFEEAFDPCDLAVYGPADEFWRTFRERMPWEVDSRVHQELVAWILRALLARESSIPGLERDPILTPLDVRTSIDGEVWHTRIPLGTRVAIDEARFRREREGGAPLTAADEIAMAGLDTITAHVPLRDLVGLFATAEKAMGFEARPPLAALAEEMIVAPEAPASTNGTTSLLAADAPMDDAIEALLGPTEAVSNKPERQTWPAPLDGTAYVVDVPPAAPVPFLDDVTAFEAPDATEAAARPQQAEALAAPAAGAEAVDASTQGGKRRRK